jgi:hypothetical protein
LPQRALRKVGSRAVLADPTLTHPTREELLAERSMVSTQKPSPPVLIDGRGGQDLLQELSEAQ